MKRTLLLSVFALALAVPASANAGTPGFVDVNLGTIDASAADPVISLINMHVPYDGAV